MELSIDNSELEILVDFLDEAMEHLEGIEERILQLENSQDKELVNSIFRPAHTIKGTASFLGLNDIKDLSHKMETLLDDLRNDRIGVSSELIDTLLDGVDCLAGMLTAVQDGINDVDQSDDKIIINIAEIEFSHIIDAIDRLEEEHKLKESNTAEKQDEKQSEKPPVKYSEPELLTGEELKNISYPMEMDISFVEESREHLDNLEQALLDLENNPENFELYNDIFRYMHSLKGGAGVLVSTVSSMEDREKHPITVFQKLAHVAEGLVQRARDNKIVLPSDIIQTLLTMVDRLKEILDGFINYDPSPARANDLIALCEQYNNDGNLQSGIDNKKSSLKGNFSDKDETENKEDAENKAKAFAISNTLSQSLSAIKAGLDGIKTEDKRESALKKIIRASNTIINVNKKLELSKITDPVVAIFNTADFLLKGEDENEDDFIASMADNLKILESAAVDHIQQAKAKTTKPEKNKISQDRAEKKSSIKKADTKKIRDAVPAGRGGARTMASFIKVPQERLDILMNLVGELIISKNNFPALAREITVDHNLPRLGKKIKSSGDHVGRITDELQNIIMKMRMLPVGTLFSKFKRLVRDLAKKLNKKIVLKLSGEETELDKTIIEILGDPLVHLIRNCADHAIEEAEERKAKGKPPEGMIHLKAYNQGQNVIIEIIDDGRGIDPDYIRLKAVEKGYMSLEELEKLDDRAVQNLIFQPGFSGAKKVSEVSGRGVGMDVVKTNVEKIGGVVILNSKKGIGTTFTITLPLTLAISKGLEVNAAEKHYYLPLDYIVETVKISSDIIRSHKNMQMAVIRGSLLPVFSLAELLGDSAGLSNSNNSNKIVSNIINHDKLNQNELNLDESNQETLKSDEFDSCELSIVVLNINGKKIALIVDCFYTEQEYVIKPLSGALSKIPVFTGATITGSGKVILIIDPVKLFN